MQDKAVLVTGAGRGIGAAMALRFAAEQPRGIVVADIDEVGVRRTAADVRELGVEVVEMCTDVAEPDQVRELVTAAENAFGPLDLVCSNAGVATGQGIHAPAQVWSRTWAINVLAHVYLAQAVLPRMVRRHEGYLLITASAAGLLGLPGDAPYSVTKHAAVGVAEWLAGAYQAAGVRVSALCPLGVRTDLLMAGVRTGHVAARVVTSTAPLLEPGDVAEAAVAGLEEERFLILPHPEVAEMSMRRAADPDAWITEQQRRVNR
ncbi:SDR family NAD(P)-dependent oxidoreductase [Amycolatopsis suaedae]|nr:SDR family NAD(P)-dependent oxidoreductase [Amycolatopsis suaedae]